MPLAATAPRVSDSGTEAPSSSRNDRTNSRPVLLVEDDPAVLSAMVMLLEEWGLSVVTAGSIEELETCIREQTVPPSLIIAD